MIDLHRDQTNLNSVASLAVAVKSGRLTWKWPLAMLFSRTVLFAFWQGVIALILAFGGAVTPLDASAGWWPVSAALAGLVLSVLLVWRFRYEGIPLKAVVGFTRGSVWRDLGTSILVFVLVAPLAVLPNLWLGQMLWGDPEAPLSLMFRALPAWAATASLILFPLSVALTELPTYFGYVMPRIEALSHRRWLGIVLPAMMLAAQHMALPFVPDWRFLVWRFGMFLPLALLLGIVLRWRPRLLPYLMAGHGLLDLSAASMLLAAAS